MTTILEGAEQSFYCSGVFPASLLNHEKMRLTQKSTPTLQEGAGLLSAGSSGLELEPSSDLGSDPGEEPSRLLLLLADGCQTAAFVSFLLEEIKVRRTDSAPPQEVETASWEMSAISPPPPPPGGLFPV